MKDRIVFFVLGVFLATIAYFAGDMGNLFAQNNIRYFDNLVVDSLVVKKSILGEGAIATFDRILIEDSLAAKESIVVGDIGKGGVKVSSEKDGAIVVIFSNFRENNDPSMILGSDTNNGTYIFLPDNLDSPNSYVDISHRRSNNNQKYLTFIGLKDHNGEKLLQTSD